MHLKSNLKISVSVDGIYMIMHLHVKRERRVEECYKQKFIRKKIKEHCIFLLKFLLCSVELHPICPWLVPFPIRPILNSSLSRFSTTPIASLIVCQSRVYVTERELFIIKERQDHIKVFFYIIMILFMP